MHTRDGGDGGKRNAGLGTQAMDLLADGEGQATRSPSRFAGDEGLGQVHHLKRTMRPSSAGNPLLTTTTKRAPLPG